MRIGFCLIIIYIVLIGCNSEERKLRQVVSYWQERKIIFPSLPSKCFRRDTVCPDMWNSKYKILRYIDSLGCTKCKLRLFDWRQLILEMEKLNLDASCIFVLGIRNFEEFEQQQEVNRFIWPVLYDSQLLLDSLNHLPTDPALQTFLLDSCNRVIAIGDPVKNKTIRKLFEEIIKGKIVL